MKFFAIVFLLMMIVSCGSSREVSANNFVNSINSAPAPSNDETLDSMLSALQQQNDLLLVFADQNFAWTRTTTYYILAKDGKDWKGYFYKGSNRPSPGTSNIIYNAVSVSGAEADSVLAYFDNNALWQVKGDNGKDFCSTSSETNDKQTITNKCNIYDANTWKILMITKNKILSPSYYAPEFYERCCPGNTDRKHFVEAAKKIQALIQKNNAQQ